MKADPVNELQERVEKAREWLHKFSEDYRNRQPAARSSYPDLGPQALVTYTEQENRALLTENKELRAERDHLLHRVDEERSIKEAEKKILLTEVERREDAESELAQLRQKHSPEFMQRLLIFLGACWPSEIVDEDRWWQEKAELQMALKVALPAPPSVEGAAERERKESE